MTRTYDIVLFGATGFTGRLVAARLAERAPEGARIALAGRSREKLEAVQSELPERARDWPLVVADSSDEAALNDLAASTTVVATTVGPYAKYGKPLVGACAANGTHYVDLTGEVLFMRETIDAFDAAAKASGAKIVHTCGFDSIPSDLGVLVLHDVVGKLGPTTFVVKGMSGTFSGGTVASMQGQIEAVKSQPELRRIAADPYALSPDRAAEPDHGKERDIMVPENDENLGWLGPFVMASINTRVVRRSNALLGHAYGPDFTYREAMGFGKGHKARATATALAAGTGALVAGMSFDPTRAVLNKVLPKPGEGPDEEARNNGFFKIDIHTTDSSGRRWKARVASQGDPGYAATSLMLAEAALCAAFDGEKLPARAGVLTPATAFGKVLVERLRDGGMTFSVTEL